ncbi:MAG: hypothetical protein ABR581_01215 [Thermoleophilaceae bacterium]
MGSQTGQASVEWTAVVLFVAVTLGLAAGRSPGPDGRSFGGFLARRVVCAARGGCRDGDAALARVYGGRDATLVRANAPNLAYERGERSLPVDYRRCRSRTCSDAPDDRDLDAHRSRRGTPATAFTRVVHRGGRTYVIYWLYYPDSNTTWLGSDRLWNAARLHPLVRLGARLALGSDRYPGFHPDDWEAYAVRIDRHGSARARASAHGHWQGCRRRRCRNAWIRSTGWSRVSRGSHAGHIPVSGARERSSTSEGLRLVPLESLDRSGYRPLPDGGIDPPWTKPAYRDPESGSS